MTDGRIGVGIVGANVRYGWGTRAHLPALSRLPEFEVRAVANAHLDTAQQTADRFGIPAAYDGFEALIADPTVDLVVVSVRVPGHFAPAMAALQAGKHVFCEWPLAVNLDQATQLRDAAQRQGVVAHVGLQGRSNPEMRRARDLIANGYIGDLLSCTMVSTVTGAGVRTPDNTYLADVTTGATVLTISAGHSLDSLRFVLGEFSEVSAIVSTQVPRVSVTGTDEIIHATAPDNIAVKGRLRNGAVVSAHIQSVPLFGTGLFFEIHGTEGALVLRSEGSTNIGDMTLVGARRGDAALAPLPPDAAYAVDTTFEAGAPANVGAQYRDILRAIRTGERVEPDFETAVELHRLIDAIQQASDTGTRQLV